MSKIYRYVQCEKSSFSENGFLCDFAPLRLCVNSSSDKTLSASQKLHFVMRPK